MQERVSGASSQPLCIAGPVVWTQVHLNTWEDPRDHTTGQHRSHRGETLGATADPAPSNAPWQEPMLAFVEPTLTAHGSLEAVTASLFGSSTS
jgi:hypothetical protein